MKLIWYISIPAWKWFLDPSSSKSPSWSQRNMLALFVQHCSFLNQAYALRSERHKCSHGNWEGWPEKTQDRGESPGWRGLEEHPASSATGLGPQACAHWPLLLFIPSCFHPCSWVFLEPEFIQIILTHWCFTIYPAPGFFSHSFGYRVAPTSALLDLSWFHLEPRVLPCSLHRLVRQHLPVTSSEVLGGPVSPPPMLSWAPELRLRHTAHSAYAHRPQQKN